MIDYYLRLHDNLSIPHGHFNEVTLGESHGGTKTDRQSHLPFALDLNQSCNKALIRFYAQTTVSTHGTPCKPRLNLEHTRHCSITGKPARTDSIAVCLWLKSPPAARYGNEKATSESENVWLYLLPPPAAITTNCFFDFGPK